MIKSIQTETQSAVASIQEGTREVDNGIALADKAGKSLHEIVGISQQVTDMVAQMPQHVSSNPAQANRFQRTSKRSAR